MALRDPDKTRSNILMVAATNFHQKGFKGTSLSEILQQADISKGALYHHFTNKQELLYAVIDEVYKSCFLSRWQHILVDENPIEAISQTVKSLADEGSDEEMCRGCPIHNLAAEMASTDEQVRKRIDALYCEIKSIIQQGFETAIDKKQVSSEIDSQQVALFFMCSLNGIPQMVKSCQEREVFVQLTSALSDYVLRFRMDK